MTDLIDITPGRIILRRPDGSAMMDTAERNPAELGRLTTTLTVNWPTAPGEYNEWLPLQGKWRHHIPAHVTTVTQVIGALSIAIAPQFYLARIKASQSLRGKAGPYQIYPRVPLGAWLPMVGSIWLDNVGIYVSRAINLAVSGNNIVLEQRQMGVGYDVDDTIKNSTQSTYTVEIDLAWGIFDG